MTPEEQKLIQGLFDRLRNADNSPKDPEAEQFIRRQVAENPSAPYLMAQAVLVQEHALSNAQSRIADLERQVASAKEGAQKSGGGFLSNLFGHQSSSNTPPASSPSAPPPVAPPRYAAPSPVAQPYPTTAAMAPGSGGGFLKTAMATAAGVAGGSLLFQGIENLIGHNAGPFGSGMEERGGMGGGTFDSGNTEVVNNYYGDQRSDPNETQPLNDPNAGQNFDPDPDANYVDTSNDVVDQGFDDSNFDPGGGDDSNLV